MLAGITRPHIPDHVCVGTPIDGLSVKLPSSSCPLNSIHPPGTEQLFPKWPRRKPWISSRSWPCCCPQAWSLKTPRRMPGLLNYLLFPGRTYTNSGIVRNISTTFTAFNTLSMLTLAARLHFQVQEVPRPDLLSPRELLVARLGKRQAQPQRQDPRSAVGKHGNWSDHRPADRTSEAISGRTRMRLVRPAAFPFTNDMA